MCCTRLDYYPISGGFYVAKSRFPYLIPFSCTFNWFNFLLWKKFSSMSGGRCRVFMKSLTKDGEQPDNRICPFFVKCISQILLNVFLRCCHMYFSDSGYSWKVSQRMEDRPAIGGSFCLECSHTCRNIYGRVILKQYIILMRQYII